MFGGYSRFLYLCGYYDIGMKREQHSSLKMNSYRCLPYIYGVKSGFSVYSSWLGRLGVKPWFFA